MVLHVFLGDKISLNSETMKKLLLSAAILFGASTAVNAQLPDGSVAPDFTITDIYGTTYNLYTYLDAGYTVVLDISATWCGPCWSYHNSGALDDLYTNHGPAGAPGVSASTTDDVMVFWVEGDASTPASEITGGGSSQGDWTLGGTVPFPLADAASVANQYQISYFPTIYTICPNRILTESGQKTATQHYALVGGCPSANGTVNGALLAYTGETVTCGAPVAMSVDLQNMGTGALTSATIEVFDGATSVLSYNWSGNLATYDIASVNLGTVTPTATTNYSIQITSTDDNASDNTLAQTVSTAQETDVFVTVVLLTDNYASETYVEIRNSSNQLIWSEGNEGVQGNYDNGTTSGLPTDATNPLSNNTTYNWQVSLPAVDCYTFGIYDYYGDGVGAAQWGGTDGDWDIKDNTGAIILSATAADFGGSDSGLVKNLSVGLGELAIEGVKVFPNPATEVLNVTFDANNMDYTVELMDLQGRTVATQSFNGASGAQTVNFSVADIAAGSYIVTISNDAVSHTENVVIK